MTSRRILVDASLGNRANDLRAVAEQARVAAVSGPEPLRAANGALWRAYASAADVLDKHRKAFARGSAPMATLKDAQAVVQAALESPEDPIDCPACTRRVQLYRRAITSLAAVVLLRMSARWREAARHGERDLFIDPNTLCEGLPRAASRNWYCLGHFGLIERDSSASPRAKRWQITGLGRAFAGGVTTLQKYAMVYEGVVHGFTGPHVNVKHCLGQRFDFEAVVAGTEWRKIGL